MSGQKGRVQGGKPAWTDGLRKNDMEERRVFKAPMTGTLPEKRENGNI